ncbi:hypothetical protein [Thioalkalivibrio sulfidiphilus]|uniref:hypothetical protein n=1 Tax=Thioalkalivibrio sulfidiphilus TaxID=1033854 RepID=UPI0011D17600|nr:hypothetical protein [Thioalkalivibrio sulfidiphilus]
MLSVAERIGLPLIRVSSNLDDFYSKPYLNKRIGFQHSHTLRNTSAALLFQKGIGRYMYASALSYEDIHIRPNDDIAYCDPMTLPLLSTESQEIISVGSEHTRVQKTLIVTELQEPQTSLDVCIRPRGITGPINCSQCRKCLRTLATLEISGKIDRYRSIFDMDMWKRKRAKFFSEVMLRDFPLLKEIDNYAKETGFKYPIQSIAYFYTGLPYVYSRYNNAIKRLKDLTKGLLKKSSYKNN